MKRFFPIIVSLLLILFHLVFKFVWAFKFFNYPTLDDVARAFTFIHSFVTGKIYLYQLDVSYHGTILLIPIYNLLMKSFGVNIFTFRLAGIIISTITIILALTRIKDLKGKIIFSLLFTFAHVSFMRNSVAVGNYSLLPTFVILILSTSGFIRAFFVGLAISTHPFFLPFLILLSPQDIIPLIIGLTPTIIFNLYNFVYNFAENNILVFPAIADMLLRSSLLSISIPGDLPLKSTLSFMFLISLYLIIKSSERTSFKLKIVSLLAILLFLSEERHIPIFMTLSMWIISNYFYFEKKKEMLPVIFSISTLFLISVYSLFNFRKDFCDSFILYPYGSKHCPDFNYESIKKDVMCLKERGIDFENIGGNIFSTGFIKFFWASSNIYYHTNPWSQGVPEEFNGEKTIRFIITYEPENKQEEPVWRAVRICHFKIKPIIPLTRKEIQESLFYGKNIYTRKTDIKEIIQDTPETLRKIPIALYEIIKNIAEKLKEY